MSTASSGAIGDARDGTCSPALSDCSHPPGYSLGKRSRRDSSDVLKDEISAVRRILEEQIAQQKTEFDKEIKALKDGQNAKTEDRVQSLERKVSKMTRELKEMKAREAQATSRLEKQVQKAIADYKPDLGKVGGRPTKHLVLANLVFYWRYMTCKGASISDSVVGVSPGLSAIHALTGSANSHSSQHDSIKLQWPSDLNKHELKHCTLLTEDLRGNARFFLATILDQCDAHLQAQKHLAGLNMSDGNLARVFGQLILTLHLPSWLK